MPFAQKPVLTYFNLTLLRHPVEDVTEEANITLRDSVSNHPFYLFIDGYFAFDIFGNVFLRMMLLICCSRERIGDSLLVPQESIAHHTTNVLRMLWMCSHELR